MKYYEMIVQYLINIQEYKKMLRYSFPMLSEQELSKVIDFLFIGKRSNNATFC